MHQCPHTSIHIYIYVHAYIRLGYLKTSFFYYKTSCMDFTLNFFFEISFLLLLLLNIGTITLTLIYVGICRRQSQHYVHVCKYFSLLLHSRLDTPVRTSFNFSSFHRGKKIIINYCSLIRFIMRD